MPPRAEKLAEPRLSEMIFLLDGIQSRQLHFIGLATPIFLLCLSAQALIFMLSSHIFSADGLEALIDWPLFLMMSMHAEAIFLRRQAKEC